MTAIKVVILLLLCFNFVHSNDNNNKKQKPITGSPSASANFTLSASASLIVRNNTNSTSPEPPAPTASTVYDDIRSVMSQVTTYLLVVSIVGCFFTIITFTAFRDILTYPIRLVLFLCVTIMIGYTAFNISGESWLIHNDGACVFIAIVVHYFLLADFSWTFCIAFNFYQMIVKRNREAHSYEKWYHLGCWGIPVCVCAIVGGLQHYGLESGAVCYITNQWSRFAAFFAYGVVIISANCILFFMIGREIQQTLAGAPKTDQRDRKQEFRVYISIFVSLGLSWIFGYIDVLIPEPNISLIFFIVFSIMTPAQGILIFIFYCINAKVALKWATLFARFLPCCNFVVRKLQTNSSSTSRGSSTSSSRGAMSSSASRTG